MILILDLSSVIFLLFLCLQCDAVICCEMFRFAEKFLLTHFVLVSYQYFMCTRLYLICVCAASLTLLMFDVVKNIKVNGKFKIVCANSVSTFH